MSMQKDEKSHQLNQREQCNPNQLLVLGTSDSQYGFEMKH